MAHTTRVLSLLAVAGLTLIASPPPRAEAMSLANPGAAGSAKYASEGLTIEVRGGHHGGRGGGHFGGRHFSGGHHWGGGRHWGGGWRHHYRPRYYYGGSSYYGGDYYGPRRVCRWVDTYYGPRRICRYRHRRWWW